MISVADNMLGHKKADYHKYSNYRKYSEIKKDTARR